MPRLPDEYKTLRYFTILAFLDLIAVLILSSCAYMTQPLQNKLCEAIREVPKHEQAIPFLKALDNIITDQNNINLPVVIDGIISTHSEYAKISNRVTPVLLLAGYDHPASPVKLKKILEDTIKCLTPPTKI